MRRLISYRPFFQRSKYALMLAVSILAVLFPQAAMGQDTYALSIGETQVTSANADNVLSDDETPTVIYDATNNILTLDNATLGSKDETGETIKINMMPITSGLENLTINLVGTNRLYGNITIARTGGSDAPAQTQTTAGTLSFTGEGTLEIECSDGVISGFSSVNFGGFNLLSNSAPGVHYGTITGAAYSALCNYANNRVAADLKLTKETGIYPIWVYIPGSVSYKQITDANKSNVLEDGFSSVSYDGNGKLTVKGTQITSSNFESFIIGEAIRALTVHITGYNQIGGSDRNAFYFLNSNATLNFTTSTTLPGSIYLNNGSPSNLQSGISYRNDLGLNEGSVNVSQPESSTLVSFTGYVSYINDQQTPKYIYSKGLEFYASDAKLVTDNNKPSYVKLSSSSNAATLYPTSLSNASQISKVIFQFDWGKFTNKDVTVQIRGIDDDGGPDRNTYSDAISLSPPDADGVIEIPLTSSVTSRNLQLYFSSSSDFSIIPLSVTYLPKADITLTFDPQSATATIGEEWTAPTLSNTSNVTVAYNSSDAKVATIDPETGAVTLVGVGVTTITANFSGNENYNATRATYTLTVKKNLSDETITIDEIGDRTYTGQAIEPPITVKDGDQAIPASAINVAYSENHTDVGTVTVTITPKTNAEVTTYYEGERTTTFKIVPATATITAADQQETDNTVSQAFSCSTDNGTTLVTYYTSEADRTAGANGSTTAPTNAGTYYVRVTLKAGNYTAEAKDATFTISPKNISVAESNTSIGDISDQTYTGSALTPQPEVTVEFSIPENTSTTIRNVSLSKETDLEFTYENNVNVPSSNDNNPPKVIITGKGNYTGTMTKTFTITPAAATISFTEASVSKTFGEDAFTNAVTNTGDGTVSYATSSETVATIDATSGLVTIVGAGEATITATVTDGTNYTYATKEASYTLNVATATMTVDAADYSGTYDGKAHTITLTAPEGATVKYGTAEKVYELDAAPTYTNVSTNTVYYQVTKTNYTTLEGSKTVTITPAAGAISYAETIVRKTFGEDAFTNAITKTGDGTVSYSSSNTNVANVDATSGQVTIEGAGTATITATVTDGTNYTYATKETSYTLNVATATMEVTAEGYSGTYDTEEHTINVNAPEDATVMYGTTEGTYNLEAAPPYTNAGTYTVYYKVTMDNYTPVTGNETVTITPAAATVSFAAPTIEKKFGDAAFTNAITNTGDGTVSYSTSSEAVAIVDATSGQVTIVGAGTATITATATDGANYTYATKTKSYTLNVATATMTVDAADYSGTYDGKAHTISVTAPEGAAVMYGTTEGTYNLQAAPTYTDVSTNTVYYQVTKPNYTTVTGSKTVTISRDLGITFAETQLWATYYSTEDLAVPEGLTAYAVSAVNATSGEVTAQELNYIPKNNAVLLMRAEGTDLTGYVAAPYSDAAEEITNILQGSTEAVSVSSITSGTVYVLYNNVFKRASGGDIPARKAYLVVSGAVGARLKINAAGQSTAIEMSVAEDGKDIWYGIDGRKLEGKPQRTGIYIYNGKKVFVNKK